MNLYYHLMYRFVYLGHNIALFGNAFRHSYIVLRLDNNILSYSSTQLLTFSFYQVCDVLLYNISIWLTQDLLSDASNTILCPHLSKSFIHVCCSMFYNKFFKISFVILCFYIYQLIFCSPWFLLLLFLAFVRISRIKILY